jgi:periplasmic mercuric ion binding protein
MTKRSMLVALSVAAAMLAPQLSFAEQKTVVISVPDMYSPACPILTRKALKQVPGVLDVKASLERKEAVVTYDDTKATQEKLVETSKHAGFPNSSVRP